MSARPNNGWANACIAIALCLCVAGCATQMPNAGNIASARDAQSAVVIDTSTKADVESALGKAIEVKFDSGYEIWVYRERSAGGFLFARPAGERAELVLLFESSGVLKKARVRTPA